MEMCLRNNKGSAFISLNVLRRAARWDSPFIDDHLSRCRSGILASLKVHRLDKQQQLRCVLEEINRQKLRKFSHQAEEHQIARI